MLFNPEKLGSIQNIASGESWSGIELAAAIERRAAVLGERGIGRGHKIVIYHVSQIHKFYGEKQGVRIARKHISWYCQKIKQNSLYKSINQIVTAKEQILALNNLFGSEKRFAA